MEFGYSIIIILLSLSTLTVILLIKLIYRHNPHYNEKYGDEIVLFHSTDRYKRRIWRFGLIESLQKIKIEGKNLNLKVIVGEFSEGTQEIIKHAANHKFDSITILGGPKVFCEDKMEIYTILDKYKSVEYFTLPQRPTKHFMIFNNCHLYIEKPHRHYESRGAVGVIKAKSELIKIYDQNFDQMIKYAIPMTKEEVLNQPCY
jgi:hypothetical protein